MRVFARVFVRVFARVFVVVFVWVGLIITWFNLGRLDLPRYTTNCMPSQTCICARESGVWCEVLVWRMWCVVDVVRGEWMWSGVDVVRV